ncbi:P-loop containing nucleoside triphosphate hydrolase protein [Mycena leptocephala]|nr:P-loop containing nucleoside triphosphate hydrolase protein [Mycena leptocephala]
MSLFKRGGSKGQSNGANGNGSGGRNGSSSSVAVPDNSPPTTTISSSDYARRCRQLMTLDKDLRELGANMFFDLPSITVIGGQSAGKSSLVEAVSGINVPRDSGTCTSSADTWSCKISLRFDYNSLGAKVETATYAFGPTITDKALAQAAILSPHLPHQDFCTKTEHELRNPPADVERLLFSKNAVLVLLCDPTITDLSFVDLPGLIQNERTDVIEVVRDLAVSRISSENTLILQLDDLQNQQAARLAKEADPAGERTIAVLTKPDILGPGATGSRQKWKDILEGKDHQLRHGYYCVRLPDDDERSRGISRAESERRAAEYFDSTQPWRDITDRSRFGVPNLATFLSELLVARIETNLPTLRQKLQALLGQYNQELLQLPSPPTSEPAAEVLLRTSAFCRAFHAAVFGDENKNVSQKNRRLYLQFKADIRSTSPDFRPFAGYLNYNNPNITDPEPRDAGVSTTGACDLENAPLDLLDVRRVIAESISWELPNHVPFGATKTLVLGFTSQWKSPTFCSLLQFRRRGLRNLPRSADDDTFRPIHPAGKLYPGRHRTLTRVELETCKDQALETLEKMLALEKLPLFTQNTHQFQTESKAWLARYYAVRNGSTRYLLGVRLILLFAPCVALTRTQALEENRDPFADELALMANVRAYWQIAYQRIIDYVPLLIEHEFNQRLAARLQEMLFENLLKGPDAGAKLQELLTEDPAIASKRTLLEGRIARLMEIKQKLDSLG